MTSRGFSYAAVEAAVAKTAQELGFPSAKKEQLEVASLGYPDHRPLLNQS
jgi:hypothetical protein